MAEAYPLTDEIYSKVCDLNELDDIEEPEMLTPEMCEISILRRPILDLLQESIPSFYQLQELTDLEVKVEDKVFKCHRVVMASVSRYFHSLLTSGMKECQNGEVELKEVSKAAFKLIMTFIYSGEYVVAMETVEELLKAAVFLCIKPLEVECVGYMTKAINSSNCIGIWRLGRSYDCRMLEQAAFRLVLEKFEQVCQMDEFLTLDKDDLIVILSDPNLDKIAEDTICESALRWTKSDVVNRECHLNHILDFVCLPKVSSPFLYDLLMDDEFLNRNQQYKAHVRDALKYHLKPDDRLEVMSKQTCMRGDSNFKKVVALMGGCYIQDEPLSCMLCLELEKLTWYTLASFTHEPGEDFATCVLGNEIYLSGGSRNPDKFIKYHPGTNNWITQPSMLTGRECHAMVEMDNIIYVIGGENPHSKSDVSHVEDIEAYNVLQGTWTNVGKLSLPMDNVSAVGLNKKLYIFGGVDEHGNASSAIQCFDPSNGDCTLTGSLPDANSFCTALSSYFEACIYVVTSNKVYKFDEAEALSKIADFDARSKYGVYINSNCLNLVGGEGNQGELLDDILCVNLHSGKVTVASKKLKIPFCGFKMEPLMVPKLMLIQKGFNIQGQLLFDPEELAIKDEKLLWPDERFSLKAKK